ncbi:unnamed protein product [Prunus brigantina]
MMFVLSKGEEKIYQNPNSQTISKNPSNLNPKILGGENNSATSFLNLLLSGLRNELGLHHNRLVLRQRPLPQHLKVPKLRHVDQRHVVSFVRRRLVLRLLRHQRPELVDVDDGAVELVAELVEVAHADFTKIPRVVLVEQDPVVVHASGISTTTGMLPVLPDSAVAGADVASLLPILLQTGRHFWPRV